jgi:glutamine amidotransferase
MCRIAAYLGRPLRLSTIVNEAPHGLTDQSRNARLMSNSSIAGDGWGIGWFCPEAGPAPGLFKSILPLWSDENAKTVVRAILSGSFVGHIRYGSANLETCFLNTPLYVLDNYLWTMNGEIQPWPGRVSMAMRERLDPEDESSLRSATDAEMLSALWRTWFRHGGSVDAGAALRAALREARDLVLAHRGQIKANVIITSATEIVAARYAEPVGSNTLYYLTGQPRWAGGTLIVSEPLDDGPGWDSIPENSLVRADAQGVTIESLDLQRGVRAPARRQTASAMP